MEDGAKVFNSNITIQKNRHKNNLYDLIHIAPAEPLKINKIPNNSCDFIPNTDKCYIPNRKSNRLKVKTVSDIRKAFEEDTYSYLINDLYRQEKYLLKKIRAGSSRDESTIILGKNIVKSGSPVSRSAWQMLININPEQHPHPKQYVLWNGKYIQINGSIGGKNKLICEYDVAINKKQSTKRIGKHILKKKKPRLLNSLDIKFKPGPLAKKSLLDDSYQRYHVGEIALVDLPKPGLDIEPAYGSALEPSIKNFLITLQKEDGTIAPKWAEFAVSVLGKKENSKVVLTNKECITFDLNYKYDQHKILMRRSVKEVSKVIKTTDSLPTFSEFTNILPEVRNIMSKILDSVEISTNQDNFYIIDEEEHGRILEESSNSSLCVPSSTSIKDSKHKNKYGELNRLDVTVIRLPETVEKGMNHVCNKLFCTLGCVCESIQGTYNLRPHCGRLECMFECKCDFSVYKKIDLLETTNTDLIPALANLDKEINFKLAKEEQKFHQTVVVAGEKQILLKSEKRNLKTPKKYADFYTKMCQKYDDKKMQIFSLNVLKLNFDNIEPWCMVHNLYKCFCKGKFTQSCASMLSDAHVKECDKDNVTSVTSLDNENINKKCIEKKVDKVKELVHRVSYHNKHLNTEIDKKNQAPRRVVVEIVNTTFDSDNDLESDAKSPTLRDMLENSSCTRVNPYTGRKFSDGYYRITNLKIYKMEKNDKSLQNKMDTILNNFKRKRTDFVNSTIVRDKNKGREEETSSELYNDGNSLLDVQIFNGITPQLDDESEPKPKKLKTVDESRLVSWLVSNYKKHKDRVQQGIVKNILPPPESGKIALFAWEFILYRYREGKNFFFVSKKEPFRIFMSVQADDPFFENCININAIRLADLNKYPQTVKNLLSSAKESKEKFCVLRGLSYCWEFIGMVTKLKDANENKSEDNKAPIIDPTPHSTNSPQKSDVHTKPEEKTNNELLDKVESSKWFVMTVENDFTEIRFQERGFFVKYENIVKAIIVARNSGKTVRLSSTKCISNSSSPQFGIYAIPYTNEQCVYVGPYEMEDSIGIQSIKNMISINKKKTRGFWITTNKVDNDRVINNPLSFMPSNDENKVTELLETSPLINCNNGEYDSSPEKTNRQKCLPNNIVKPIKISKSSGTYRLSLVTQNGSEMPILKLPTTKRSSTLIKEGSYTVSNIDSEINTSDGLLKKKIRKDEEVNTDNTNKSSKCNVKSKNTASDINVSEFFPVIKRHKDQIKNTYQVVTATNQQDIVCDMNVENKIHKNQQLQSIIIEDEEALSKEQQEKGCDAVTEIGMSDVFTINEKITAQNDSKIGHAESSLKVPQASIVQKHGENTDIDINSFAKSHFIEGNETIDMPKNILKPVKIIHNPGSEIEISEIIYDKKNIEEQSGKNKCESLNEVESLQPQEITSDMPPAFKISEIFFVQEGNDPNKGIDAGKFILKRQQTASEVIPDIKISDIIFVQNESPGENKITIKDVHSDIMSAVRPITQRENKHEEHKDKIISRNLENAELDAKRTSDTELETKCRTKVPEKGMFILKPEEINRKLLHNKLFSESSLPKDSIANIFRDILDKNIENSFDEDSNCHDNEVKVFDKKSYQNWFGNSSTHNLTTNIFDEISNNSGQKLEEDNNSDSEVCIISDDDDESDGDNSVQVWLQCKDSQVGWISAKRNTKNMLCFKSSGGVYSKYCPEEELITSLNMKIKANPLTKPLERKALDWTIVESVSELKGDEINLSSDIENQDFKEIRQCRTKGGIKTYSKVDRKGVVRLLNTILDDHRSGSK